VCQVIAWTKSGNAFIGQIGTSRQRRCSPFCLCQTSRHSHTSTTFMLQSTTLARYLLLAVLAAAALLQADAAVSRSYTEACALWDARSRPETQNVPQWTGGVPTGNCSTSSPGTMNVRSCPNKLQMILGPLSLSFFKYVDDSV
jgi:hypothetical protein